MGRVLGIVYRVMATHLIAMDGMYAGFAGAKTGDQEGWAEPQDGLHWCSHADSTVWIGAESEYSFPHVVFGWCLC